jgi:hypothetical protein
VNWFQSERSRRNIVKRYSVLSLAIFVALGGAYYGALGNAHVWTGYVTDTHCGTHCQMTSHMTPHLKCIRLCVNKGSKYGLWSGDRVYVLEPQARAALFAAQQVTVTGTVEGSTIHMRSIRPVFRVGRAGVDAKPQ